jgi:hypothetical protein
MQTTLQGCNLSTISHVCPSGQHENKKTPCHEGGEMTALELVGQARVMILAKLSLPLPAFKHATHWTTIGLTEATGLPQFAIRSAISQMVEEGKVCKYKLDGFTFYWLHARESMDCAMAAQELRAMKDAK